MISETSLRAPPLLLPHTPTMAAVIATDTTTMGDMVTTTIEKVQDTTITADLEKDLEMDLETGLETDPEMGPEMGLVMDHVISSLPQVPEAEGVTVLLARKPEVLRSGSLHLEKPLA